MAVSEPVIVSIVSRPFQENTYVAHRMGQTDCLVVDPGLEPTLILNHLRSKQLQPVMILNTHGHGDHIGGNAAVKGAYPAAPLVIGELDEPMLSNPMLNMSGMTGFGITSPPADRLVREGDMVEAAGFRMEVRHIPGHSPGHVVFICTDDEPKIVFGGDVLFAGAVGRWDLPGGNGRLLIAGIREKLLSLPNDTRVLPGHGGETTVGTERATNPYVGDSAMI
jgi:glyoxylase-like metal-dependent hydrolase (beta-lactamase superfamily II)